MDEYPVDKEQEHDAAKREEIVAMGSVTTESDLHCISIIGQIEGHMVLPPQNKTTKYEHILPMLVAIEESSDIKGFIVLMNTVGGDVEAGMALAEMIASMRKPSVSLVLGGGHSIGVPLAVAARCSYIAPTATMTIHPIRMNGLFIGVPQTVEYVNRMQERVVRFVCGHSTIPRERFMEMMLYTGDLMSDIGSVLVGEEAVACGLIDRVGGLSDALSALRRMIGGEEP